MYKQLKTISIENNNYHIFKVESKEGVLEIYFIWGKTDFCSFWHQEQNVWIRRKIQIYKNSQWYFYQRISNHGIFLEEVYWKNDQDDLYIDLPKNFSAIVNQIFQQVNPHY